MHNLTDSLNRWLHYNFHAMSLVCTYKIILTINATTGVFRILATPDISAYIKLIAEVSQQKLYSTLKNMFKLLMELADISIVIPLLDQRSDLKPMLLRP